MYLCLFAYLVSRIYLQKHIISYNISQFLSHSSAYCGNQENWHCSGSNKSHKPLHHCQSFIFSLIKYLLHLYYVNSTKLLILLDISILYAIIHSRFDKSTHALNCSYLLLESSLEFYGKKSWDSRLGYRECCCSYTSPLIKFTFPYNAQPSCTLCASCFTQSTRALASMYKCHQLLPCKLYPIKRKLVSSTCKGKKRRPSRSNTIITKE